MSTGDELFRKERNEIQSGYERDEALRRSAHAFLEASVPARYSYNFDWLGRPIIQYPQDIVAMQELIARVKPDLIVETGIARGGSLVFYASMLALLEYSEAAERGERLDPSSPRRRVLGIDVDIRKDNRVAIEAHPMRDRITMIEGSSIDPGVVQRVCELAAGAGTILVSLDSNHTHEHVLAELRAYAPLTSRGSYCVVFDTMVEDMPDGSYPDRPWGRGDNPKTAVRAYLEELSETAATGADGAALELEIDTELERKLLISVAPEGYLRRL